MMKLMKEQIYKEKGRKAGESLTREMIESAMPGGSIENANDHQWMVARWELMEDLLGSWKAPMGSTNPATEEFYRIFDAKKAIILRQMAKAA